MALLDYQLVLSKLLYSLDNLLIGDVRNVDSEPMTRRQFWNDHNQAGNQIYDKQGEVVVGVVGGYQEQADWDTQQKLLHRGELGTVIDLFPHVQVVERAVVEVKWRAFNLVEHYIGTNDVGHVGQGPAHLVAENRHQVVKDLQHHDHDDVDDPGALEVHPVGVHVVHDVLVLLRFKRFRLDFGDQGRRSSTPVALVLGMGCRWGES